MGPWRTSLTLLAIVATLALAGCGAKPDVASAPPAGSSERPAPQTSDVDPVKVDVEQTAKSSPDDALYEQLRAGSVQLESAAASIQEALAAVKTLQAGATGELQEALDDIAALLDSAGVTVTDAAGDAPTRDQVRANFSTFDDRRLKAIEAANDANKELTDAAGQAASLAESDPKFEDLANLIDVAAGDVRDAISALGGEVEAAPDLGDSAASAPPSGP